MFKRKDKGLTRSCKLAYSDHTQQTDGISTLHRLYLYTPKFDNFSYERRGLPTLQYMKKGPIGDG
jgi:hypothetical protein